MSKKIALSIIALVLLAIAGNLIAQQTDRSGSGQTQQRRSGAGRTRYTRPEPLTAEAEKKILAVLEDMHANQSRCMGVTLKKR